jgi:hypothetical protein
MRNALLVCYPNFVHVSQFWPLVLFRSSKTVG